MLNITQMHSKMRKWSALGLNQRGAGLFVILSLVVIVGLFIVLRFIPIGMTFQLSFHRWTLMSPERPFVGLTNYSRLLSDFRYRNALMNSLLFAFVVGPTSIALGLGLAMLLDRPLRFRAVFETLFFLPSVLPMVPIAMAWRWIYDPSYGVLNFILRCLGLPAVGWLTDPNVALYSVMIVVIWQNVGFNMMVLLVGLRGIPQDYIDAASVDGAQRWSLFIRIKLPLIMPLVLYLMVMNAIEALKVFAPVYVLTFGAQAALGTTTRVVALEIYQNAFRYFKMGYASAQAVVFLLIVLILSLLIFKAMRRTRYEY